MSQVRTEYDPPSWQQSSALHHRPTTRLATQTIPSISRCSLHTHPRWSNTRLHWNHQYLRIYQSNFNLDDICHPRDMTAISQYRDTTVLTAFACSTIRSAPTKCSYIAARATAHLTQDTHPHSTHSLLRLPSALPSPGEQATYWWKKCKTRSCFLRRRFLHRDTTSSTTALLHCDGP